MLRHLYICFCLLLFPAQVWAATITTVMELDSNSTLTSKGGTLDDTYQLATGVHYIPSGDQVFIMGSPTNNIHLTTGASLTAGSAGGQISTVLLVDNFFVDETGSLTSFGGSMNSVLGIYVAGSFWQDSGSVTTTGGSADNGHGIRVADNYMFNGGTLLATGGSAAPSNYGLHIIGNFIQNDSVADIVSAKGSVAGTVADTNNFGMYVQNSFIQNGAGTLLAEGGQIGMRRHGLKVFELDQAGAGVITAIGGFDNASFNYGIDAVNVKQTGNGTINATGGNGVANSGINIMSDLHQEAAGTIIAAGGSAQNAHGIFIGGSLQQNGAGTIMATGGSAQNAHGIYVNETANFTANVHLMPDFMAAGKAIYINNNSNVATALTFTADSKLILEFDVNSKQTGLLQVNQGNTDIVTGATVVVPRVQNAFSLPLDQTYTSLFLETVNTGTINNEFAVLNTNPIFDFKLIKNGTKYYLAITRIQIMVNTIQANLLINEENLMKSFADLKGLTTPESALLREYADIFENATTAEEAVAIAWNLQRNMGNICLAECHVWS